MKKFDEKKSSTSEYGSGDGDGSGNGYSYDDIIIHIYRGKDVYYINKLPVIIYSIEENIALCDMININNFALNRCYFAKYNNVFAYSYTAKYALEAAMDDYIRLHDIDSRILLFKEKFLPNIKYSAKEFCKWYSLLNDVSSFDYNLFFKKKGINLDKDEFTVKYFIELTINGYGSSIIKKLNDYYK